jgi:hypothetical protein
MIREPDITGNLTLTVKLTNGELFENVDTTRSPFGANENQVAFWTREGKLSVYPMHQVAYVEFNP